MIHFVYTMQTAPFKKNCKPRTTVQPRDCETVNICNDLLLKSPKGTRVQTSFYSSALLQYFDQIRCLSLPYAPTGAQRIDDDCVYQVALNGTDILCPEFFLFLLFIFLFRVYS